MPQVWRILSFIDRVTALWDEAFPLHDLLLHYEIRVKAKNRIALHAKARLEPLVGGIQSNDRGLKNRFVSVKRSSLGEARASLVDGWNTEGLNPKLLSHRDESQSLCDKFLKVSEEDRQFRRVLFASQDSRSSMASSSSQPRPRGSLDGQALTEMLRKRKRESSTDVASASSKKDTAVVVHLDDELDSLLKGHLTMKQRMEKAELDAKSKSDEEESCKKAMEDMKKTLQKNGEELEEIRQRATKLEESSRHEITTLQASVDAQKNELDMLEAEVTTRVKAKLMYQFLMKKTASWTPQKDIDLYLQFMGSMKDLMDEEDLAAMADSSSKVDENAPSCAGLIASNVPPDPETEKEAPTTVLPAKASEEKEAEEVPTV
ncbi:hypothetical protein BVRB_6g156150 [Beta vulgaris subsp. vulgaris]|uniref:Uncharacterized protein n=1 Tax=Beta vulgaris subsp. vulgaris TaxID=3555 RepID=A0A0J8B8N4_BETVV|nr:hypothetical protein BVRB_6g156150 [Beta vulgaris subsp. vulgaris]